MAELITAAGKSTQVHPKDGKYFSLEEMQQYVGGYIQIIPIMGKQMVINEEGKQLNLPRNELATMIASWIANDDFVVGDVLVVNDAELED